MLAILTTYMETYMETRLKSGGDELAKVGRRLRIIHALRRPVEFNDMSPKSLPLQPHCPFPDMNSLSNFTPVS